jgi:hypothetical protein
MVGEEAPGRESFCFQCLNINFLVARSSSMPSEEEEEEKVSSIKMKWKK